jgi:hypothetical protein
MDTQVSKFAPLQPIKNPVNPTNIAVNNGKKTVSDIKVIFIGYIIQW